jgi:hypothetical protein
MKTAPPFEMHSNCPSYTVVVGVLVGVVVSVVVVVVVVMLVVVELTVVVVEVAVSVVVVVVVVQVQVLVLLLLVLLILLVVVVVVVGDGGGGAAAAGGGVLLLLVVVLVVAQCGQNTRRGSTCKARQPTPWAASTKPGARRGVERTTSPTEGPTGLKGSSGFGLKTNRAQDSSHQICVP